MHSFCVLLSDKVAVKPQTKFFLMLFVERYGLQSATDAKVKTIADELRISDRLASRGLNELVDKGYLERLEERLERGRPRRRHRATSALIEIIQEQGVNASACHYAAHIQRLLITPRVQAEANSDYSLKIPTRLLAAVLLGFCDRGGMVRHLGLAKLRSLTGMNRDQLKYQLCQLMTARLLRAVAPGVTGAVLFGASPGTYFLNLRHPIYGPACLGGLTVVLSFESQYLDETAEVARLAQALPPLTYQKRRKRDALRIVLGTSDIQDHDLAFENMAHFFKDLQRQEFRRFMQVKIEQYAAALLSLSWCSLERADTSTNRSIRNKITTELISAKLRREGVDAQECTPEQMVALVDFVYVLSLRFARKVKATLTKYVAKNFPPADFVILPTNEPGYREHIAIELIPKVSSAPLSDSFVHVKLADASAEVVPYECERDLKVRDRVSFGLISAEA